MKKFTRILAIVLALATIFSFAACSSKDGGEKKMKVGFIFLHDETRLMTRTSSPQLRKLARSLALR